MGFRSGTYFDGTRTQIILTPSWNASSHIELSGDYQYSRIRFDDRSQSADLHLSRLRVRTALNSKATGNAFVPYNSTTHQVDFNVRLRYHFSEGTDPWIVYNEGLNTARSLEPGQATLPLSMSRALIVKYSYTFRR